MEDPDDLIDESERPQEPSITSDDPNERKLARRLRIQRRLEEAAKIEAIKNGTFVEPEPEKPALDQAIEDSEDVLENLLLEGKELVSNIMVASDARETERREIEVEDRNKRVKMLEEEAAVALEKLGEITTRWEMIQDVNDPLSLNEHMKEQKAKCLDLIQQKNDLIKKFQMELKLADEKYMKDRRKMYDDLSLLTRRIDEQVLVMKKAYRLELKNIESVIDTTRTKITEKHERIWNSLYNQREKEEVSNMLKRLKMVENHEAELDELHKYHEEKYRETRIRLESDIQTLEQELEKVKAMCLLNSEKLDYNYQVLKKREEENIYIKNHQKRKLNKLQDIVNDLKKKIDEKQSNTESELRRLHQDVLRFHDNVIDLEKKAEHFSHLNEDTYQNIWEMKDQEAREKLQKILTVDKVIHEQILGISWKEPETKLLEKTDLPSFKAAKKTINEMLTKPVPTRHTIDLGEREMNELKRAEFEEGHRNVLKQILEMVADQSGFLIEEKVDDLLKPYTSEEKTLVRLDNVFTAIGIRTEEDINLMKDIFLPYAICPLCEQTRHSEPSLQPDLESNRTQVESYHTTSQGLDIEEKFSKVLLEGSVASIDESTRTEEGPAVTEARPSKDPVQFLDLDEQADKTITFTCSITHPLVIDKVYVLYALKDFVTEFLANNCPIPTGMSARLAKQRNTISRMMAKDDVEKYWNRYKNVFPAGREKLWDVIFIGLTRYHGLLKDRHKLNLKAQKLRQQNAELRRLLARYVTAEEQQNQNMLPVISKNEKNIADMDNLRQLVAKAKQLL
ncbi:UNVERIFIED_CONTAM: hypothetical protein PYX00_002719 [Menopon gallinae]|uniref:Dynein regulatory complex protein 1 n=1 Tax=Menopon gallinae TaxID=328185 RepID=A0AAW2HYG9_9NEOP